MDNQNTFGVVTVISGTLTIVGAEKRQFGPGTRFIVLAHSPDAGTGMPGYTNHADATVGATFIADVYQLPTTRQSKI